MSISMLLLGALVLAPPMAAAELPPGAAGLAPHRSALLAPSISVLDGFDTGLPIGAGDMDWDDDGDCYCEVGPCSGSVRSECGQVNPGDCMDNPNDDRAKHVNPGRDELCDDAVDNDCNGLVNDGCSDSARYATVQGGGCSSSPRSLLPSLAFLLALPLALRRRALSHRVAPRS